MTDNQNASRPTLHVISGDATPEEIAAILALVGARGHAISVEHLAQESATVWSAPSNAHRRSRSSYRAHRHGWRTSYWPS